VGTGVEVAVTVGEGVRVTVGSIVGVLVGSAGAKAGSEQAWRVSTTARKAKSNFFMAKTIPGRG